MQMTQVVSSTPLAVPIEQRVEDNESVIDELVLKNIDLLKKNIQCFQEEGLILEGERVMLQKGIEQFKMTSQEEWSGTLERANNSFRIAAAKIELLIAQLSQFKEPQSENSGIFNKLPQEHAMTVLVDFCFVNATPTHEDLMRKVYEAVGLNEHLRCLETLQDIFQKYKITLPPDISTDAFLCLLKRFSEETISIELCPKSVALVPWPNVVEKALQKTLSTVQTLGEKVSRKSQENALLRAQINFLKDKHPRLLRAFRWCVFRDSWRGFIARLERVQLGVSLSLESKAKNSEEWQAKAGPITQAISTLISEIKDIVEYYKNPGEK